MIRFRSGLSQSGKSHDLAPQTSLAVNAKFRTPDQEGEFVLLWDFFQKKNGWLSVRGIDRKMVPCSVYVDPDQAREGQARFGLKGAAHYVQAFDARKQAQTQYLSRRMLWKSAWKMFQDHPWMGIGGGNFRLFYWKYLGVQYWHERILANSLYLEFLADVGLIGTSLLLLFLGAVLTAGLGAAWRAASDQRTRLLSLALMAAFVGWMAHSVVDYFLEFTPTYLLFWIWAGVIAALKATATAGHHRVSGREGTG